MKEELNWIENGKFCSLLLGQVKKKKKKKCVSCPPPHQFLKILKYFC